MAMSNQFAILSTFIGLQSADRGVADIVTVAFCSIVFPFKDSASLSVRGVFAARSSQVAQLTTKTNRCWLTNRDPIR